MSFKVPDKKQIPEMEDEVLSFWKSHNIFEESVEKNSEDNLYVFYDGPPFISGLPHYGHLLASIAKDVIPRFWTMKGKRVERLWGWDAHGLTVENRVQENLGIKKRRDIENYGLDKFTQACYEYTSKISAEWKWYIDKIGRWVDFDNAYRTTDQTYMESVMWAFKQIYEKGLIYEGIRTSLFCPTCGTPVSDFEIAMDNSYREENDPSITVKFRVVTDGDFKDHYLLAWTTTPWTLPSNRALVIDDKETYVSVFYDFG
jgi:isoleucyl-tRNA synthetase